MKEIGGYLGLEEFKGQEYHVGAFSFNTAKNALLWIIKNRSIKKIWMPEYLCPSVIKAVREIGKCEVLSYDINENFLPQIPFDRVKLEDTIYLVNYYGQLCWSWVLKTKEQLPNIIVDNVQAFFEKPLSGVDTIYSCRKWFGVPDGAYLYTNCEGETDYPLATASERMTYLLGRYEKGASEYYSEFQKNEEILNKQPILKMSALSHNFLCGINYEEIKRTREKNFTFLHKELGVLNKLRIHSTRGNFMYPFMLNGVDGLKIRKELAEKKIYIPTLWPGLSAHYAKFANIVLPLPVDHRYDIKDMEYLVESIIKTINYIKKYKR